MGGSTPGVPEGAAYSPRMACVSSVVRIVDDGGSRDTSPRPGTSECPNPSACPNSCRVTEYRSTERTVRSGPATHSSASSKCRSPAIGSGFGGAG